MRKRVYILFRGTDFFFSQALWARLDSPALYCVCSPNPIKMVLKCKRQRIEEDLLNRCDSLRDQQTSCSQVWGASAGRSLKVRALSGLIVLMGRGRGIGSCWKQTVVSLVTTQMYFISTGDDILFQISDLCCFCYWILKTSWWLLTFTAMCREIVLHKSVKAPPTDERAPVVLCIITVLGCVQKYWGGKNNTSQT